MSDEILRDGSRGDAVRKLQEDLNTLGYAIAVDGIFGPNTEKAVRALQTAFGYTIDGLVGKGTRFLIEQQKALKWRADMPKAPPPSEPVAKPAPPASAGAAQPQAKPAAPPEKGPVGDKTTAR
jgi:peptidoglycan hydrolase-like protein with peptidoglycan-binding domain